MSGDIIIPSGTGGSLTVEIEYNGPAGANGVGVPAGGTTGQILAKNSNTDYDTEWVNDAGSGTTIAEATEGSPGVGDFIPYLTAALAPGKVEGDYYAVAASLGDLALLDTVDTAQIDNSAVTYSKIQDVAANSVLARAAGGSGVVSAVALAASQLLGRGSTGNVNAITLGTNLSMSGTTLNATGGGGGGVLSPRSGAWLASGSGANSAAIMGSSGRIFYVPLIVPASCTIDRIGIHVQAGDAGTNAKLGIYGSTSDRLPGSLIAACASPVSTATSGLKEGTFSSNPTLAAGLYWLAWQTDSSGFTLQPRVIANSTLVWMENSIGTTNYVGEVDIAAIEAGTYASGLPATAAAPTINLGGGWFSPAMSVRVA